MRHVPVKGHRGIYFSVNKTGKVYEVRWRDLDGKQHFRVVGPDLKAALAEQSQINVKLGKGTKAHYAPMTFGQVAQEWSEYKLHRVSAGTERKYRSALDNFLLPEFRSKRIRSITTDQIAQFLSELRTESGKKMSGSYAQSIYVVLYSVMSFAANERRGYIPRNPCDSLEAGERPRPESPDKRALTQAEAQALLQHSPEWFKPVLLTALTTGMRASEILGLRWDYIDFTENRVLVHYQLSKAGAYVPTKGREKREVPLLPSLRTVLFALPSRFSGEHLFTQTDGGRATYDGLQRAFQATRDAAGIPGVTIHACRHTWASAQLRSGGDVAWVSEKLGHKDAGVTLSVYAHVIQRDNRNEEAADRLREALGELG